MADGARMDGSHALRRPGLFEVCAAFRTKCPNVKMWNAMFHRYGLWPAEETQLEGFLKTALLCAGRALTDAAAALPQNQRVVVFFDTLIKDPLRSLHIIQERLGLEVRAVQADLHTGVQRAEYPGNALPPAIEEISTPLREAYAAALASHGI
jgi:hypothetical protein